MTTQSQHIKTSRFQELHQPGTPFIMPNPWDVGSARILERAGYPALATTSAGFALTLGRKDYGVSREEAMQHAALIADSVDIPVSADLENGFGSAPEETAETIRQASLTGLAGGSIEDSTGDANDPVFEETHAVERIAAAAEAAKPSGFVLTARAEAFLYGSTDLDGVIRRLQRFSDAGADVLFAPGLPDINAVRVLCEAIAKPVNVLILGKILKEPVKSFAEAGVARISTGSGMAWNAYAALAANAASISRDEIFTGLKDHAETMSAVGKALK